MKKGLVIIDVQNDYFKEGKMPLVGMEKAVENCRAMLDHFREKQIPIFHLRHIAIGEGATFFIPDTKGSEIHKLVNPVENETVVVKHFPNAFRDTLLSDLLHRSGVKELVICGAMSHMCVDTTVRAAFDLGYTCNIISDACATRDLEFGGRVVNAADVHAAFMASLNGSFARVLTTEKFLES